MRVRQATMASFIFTSVAAAALNRSLNAARAAGCFVTTNARPSNLFLTFGASARTSQRSEDVRPRLYGATRRVNYRKRQADKAAADGVPATNELNWETFDFSTNPKLDKRFNEDIRNLFDDEEFSKVVESEAEQDKLAARKFDALNEAYRSLDPAIVAAATEVLEPYINVDRLERIDSVLAQRTKRSKFLFENPSNPSNVWACLRTIDSFGIQNVDVIIESGRYMGKQAISQKTGMRAAMGSAKWLSLRNHPTTEDAVRKIKDEGYLIYASDLNPNSQDVREVNWDAGPICVVMGNEDRGISKEMRDLADVTFTLPMCGFAESFNLSVATSITLAHMSAKSTDGKGPLRPGDLEEHELACLRLKGLLGSLPQKRMGKSLLKQKGIELPRSLDLL